MGGASAPDDLDQAHRTQAWLAISDEANAKVTSSYFYHQQRCEVHHAAREERLQERLLDICQRLWGVDLSA